MFANCSRRKASAFPCPPATSSWSGGPGALLSGPSALGVWKTREARMTVRRLAGALTRNSWPVVPVSLIGDSRRSGASRRARSLALAAIFYLAVPPAGVVAQVATTALAEFVPPLSFGVSRLDDTGLRNLGATSAPETAERTSFSTGEVLDPIPKTSSITFQPTY